MPKMCKIKTYERVLQKNMVLFLALFLCKQSFCDFYQLFCHCDIIPNCNRVTMEVVFAC